MATKKDLVEAYSFSRRRLVTAFVSGAPGGREVEPARPGRTIVGGLALAVLLMAGAAIAGVFDPKTSIDWDEPAFIIAKDKGSIYVIIEPRPGDTEPTLRPITSTSPFGSSRATARADCSSRPWPSMRTTETRCGGVSVGR